jgi:hypothetical protein
MEAQRVQNIRPFASLSVTVKLSPCHAERSEASRHPASKTLRGVYPKRSEWAQGGIESVSQVMPYVYG